jgi:hypothetical protein
VVLLFYRKIWDPYFDIFNLFGGSLGWGFVAFFLFFLNFIIIIIIIIQS